MKFCISALAVAMIITVAAAVIAIHKAKKYVEELL